MVVVAIALFSILIVLAMRWANPPTSSFIAQRALAGVSIQRQWQDFEDIAPVLAIAVIAAEDQRFAEHHGFDTESIRQAWNERRAGKRQRGASTITQQLAKNLFLWSGSNRFSRWLRKALEVWFTFWLEVCLPKERILELYLNLAEFGDGIYGAEAGSRHYFSKTSNRLTRREAALLAALLPSPRRYRIQPPTPFIEQRVAWIQQQSRLIGGPAVLERLD